MFAVIAHTFKLLTWNLVKDFLHWPLWWYTTGLRDTWHKALKELFDAQRRLGVKIWIVNWFKPMYAQADLQGRLISFFFRTLAIFWKSALFLAWVVIVMGLMVLYVVLPPLALVLLIRIMV